MILFGRDSILILNKIYFRAGFDIDIKQDLLLGFEYLKIFNLTASETFKFLKNNLKLVLQKRSVKNNREFKISKVK